MLSCLSGLTHEGNTGCAELNSHASAIGSSGAIKVERRQLEYKHLCVLCSF